jgi:hypothetical protein
MLAAYIDLHFHEPYSDPTLRSYVQFAFAHSAPFVI